MAITNNKWNRFFYIIAVVLAVTIVVSCDSPTSNDATSDSPSDDEASYSIGDTGPAGGIVFYDKGSYSDGWRYLEAARSDIEAGRYVEVVQGEFDVSEKYTHSWGESVYPEEPPEMGTDTTIGTGASNTVAIIDTYGSGFLDMHGNTRNYAARIVDQYGYGGYDDWFLPSAEELNQMYRNKGIIGNFEDDNWLSDYWSSSENNSVSTWAQDFSNGDQINNYGKDSTLRVRAIRAF